MLLHAVVQQLLLPLRSTYVKISCAEQASKRKALVFIYILNKIEALMLMAFKVLKGMWTLPSSIKTHKRRPRDIIIVAIFYDGSSCLQFLGYTGPMMAPHPMTVPIPLADPVPEASPTTVASPDTLPSPTAVPLTVVSPLTSRSSWRVRSAQSPIIVIESSPVRKALPCS